MAVIFKTYNIPNTSRRKYGDYPSDSNIVSSSKGSGSGSGGGVGTTEYMTAFQTTYSGDTWNVSGVTALSSLYDGVAVKVRFNEGSISGQTNYIDFGLTYGENSATTYPIYFCGKQVEGDEIKAGDELMLTFRDVYSGWTVDASNERYARELWDKQYSSGFSATSGIAACSPYTVVSSGDVIAYGAEENSGWTELSVIDDLESTATPHYNYALSAYMGKVLSGLINTKQDILVSGVTIKTINGENILGSGNIQIQGGSGGSGTIVVGSGLTYQNGEYRVSDEVFNAIDNKYDKTGGYVSGSVIASGDVVSYGGSEFSGFSLEVINSLNSNSTTNALSANMGKTLSGMVNDRQEKLESGTNIKTINGQSLLGSGNIEIQGGGGGTQYYEGSGISISNSTISVSPALFGEIYGKANSAGTYTGLTVGSAASATTAKSATTAGDSAKLGGSASTVFAKVSQINALNDALNLKYDKTGGTVNGSVHATGTVSADGDVMSYGASSVVPTGITVINNLTSTSTTNALSAKQGKVLNEKFSGKQDTLVSGTNIKTINGQSLLGSGNIEVQGGGGGTQYYEGSGISISNSTISVSGPLFAEIYGKANSAGTYTGLTVGSAASASTSLSADTAGDSAKLGGSAATEFAKVLQINSLNGALDGKYDKTGGTITGNVQVSGTIEATKDIMTYGASNITPTGITVIQDLIHSANTLTNVLAARQGYLLDKNKQDKLVSGTNIKTINGNTLLGSGNIVIEGGGTEYTGGTNIQISNGTISVTGAVQSAITSVSATTAKSAATATDSAKLGGTEASNYANTTGTYSGMTVGTATTWSGYKIVVGPIPDSQRTDTIYFGT